jgi:acetylornithine deacetylase/succinyl-diaminopimelate desuccinylase family protein
VTELYSTLAELIRINSVNSFYEHGPGEGEIAGYIEQYFAKCGIETWRQPVIAANDTCGDRWNVIARLPGVNPTRRVVLEAHMDTVSVAGMSIPPFEASVQNGRMYGRGACDTKAGLAAMMHALASLKDQGEVPPCEVWLAAVVDEEYSFQGALALSQGLKADAAIVAEPTDLRMAIASKGVLRWRMIAVGKSAHSSKVHLGTNAIYHMSRIALAIEEDCQRLASTVHPLLGPATCNVGKIAGGVQVNFVPDRCVIEIDRRMLPGESVPQVLNHYAQLIHDLKTLTPDLDVQMESPMLVDEAWSVEAGSEVVRTAGRVMAGLDLNPQPLGVPFGSDASKLGRAGIPTIIFGPGSIDQAHAAVEFIELAQVDQACEFYRQFLLQFGL